MEINFDYLFGNGGGGGDISVNPLSVTENGSYVAPDGEAYTPVDVNVPSVSTLEITQEEYDALETYDPQIIYLITQ